MLNNFFGGKYFRDVANILMQNNYMEGSGSVTIKKLRKSPSIFTYLENFRILFLSGNSSKSWLSVQTNLRNG